MILNTPLGRDNTSVFRFLLDILFRLFYTSIEAPMEASQLYLEDPLQNEMKVQGSSPRECQLSLQYEKMDHLRVRV